MKFLLLVCWDAEKMDALTEPDPTDTPDEEGFPWLDDLQARGIWVTGDQLAPPRRGRSAPRGCRSRHPGSAPPLPSNRMRPAAGTR